MKFANANQLHRKSRCGAGKVCALSPRTGFQIGFFGLCSLAWGRVFGEVSELGIMSRITLQADRGAKAVPYA
jgi:hypothetical protein